MHPDPEFASMSVAEMRTVCRFCLGLHSNMRKLSPKKMSSSDIPTLFASVTALELDFSPLYSHWICDQCEDQLRVVCQIRKDFLRIVDHWKFMLAEFNNENVHHTFDECLSAKLSINGICVNVNNNPLNYIDNCAPNYNDEDPMDCVEVIEDTGHLCESEREGRKEIKMETPTIELNSKNQNYRQLNKAVNDFTLRPDDWLLECDICGKTRTNKPLMLQHMIDNHMPTTASSTYICDRCSSSFGTIVGLRDHQKQHQTSPINTSDNKPNHDDCKSSAVPTTCPVCGKTNIKKKSMAVHIQMHQNRDKYKCSHCARGFERLLSLQQHERQHTGERPFVCEICAFTFTSKAGLSNHIKLHALPLNKHKPLAKIQRLPMQLAKPVSKVALQHRGIRPECPLCHSTFANRKSILGHMKLQHGVEGLDAWKKMIDTTCMVCYEQFLGKDELNRHRPVHFDHHCHLCPRHFHSKLSLDTHVQMHSTKSRPFKCELCDCAYTSATMLKIHFRRAHTEERPFQCIQCGSSFAEKSELSTHTRRVHSRINQIQPFVCTMCPAKFRSKNALRGHTENHTGKYRFCVRFASATNTRDHNWPSTFGCIIHDETLAKCLAETSPM